MKREIKFRAWYQGKMNPVRTLEIAESSATCVNHSAVNPVLMQFTGLLDKNGKEIYEDDICKRNGHIRIIRYVEGAFFTVPTKGWQEEVDIDHLTAIAKGWFLANFTSDIEVIGNVHANPELL